jgi:hypothetical protein
MGCARSGERVNQLLSRIREMFLLEKRRDERQKKASVVHGEAETEVNNEVDTEEARLFLFLNERDLVASPSFDTHKKVLESWSAEQYY